MGNQEPTDYMFEICSIDGVCASSLYSIGPPCIVLSSSYVEHVVLMCLCVVCDASLTSVVITEPLQCTPTLVEAWQAIEVIMTTEVGVLGLFCLCSPRIGFSMFVVVLDKSILEWSR